MSGRGRGRGRGRGGPLVVARDDEGNAVDLDTGPPPLFPPVNLPTRQESDAHDERLRSRYWNLLRAYKSSPYHLEHVSAARGLGRFKDMQQQLGTQEGSRTARQQQLALSSVMTLSPQYFPEELFSAKDQQASGRAAMQAPWHKPASKANASDLHWLDQLASMEGAAGGTAAAGRGAERDGAAAEGEKNAEERGEDEDDEEDLELEEDDALDGADDYNQGMHFDDDEGYDDPYDDGGDDGATY